MSFWKQVFSEPGPEGTGSFSRVSAFLVVVTVLGWLTYIVVKTGGLPSDLTNVGTFMAVQVTMLYGLNKVVTKIGK